MDHQDIIKIMAASLASICILTGIYALFKGLKADGEIDLKGLVSGKVKTGSAGVILLFFGTIIFCSLIAKGYNFESNKIQSYDPAKKMFDQSQVQFQKQGSMDNKIFIIDSSKGSKANTTD